VKVSEIGEFGLIKLLSEEIEKTGSINTDKCRIIAGIGDDAALWHCNDPVQIATTDTLIQDTHFDFAYTGWRDIGYKAIAVNLSDIAAMGGTPLFALVSLSLPENTEVDNVLDAYRGMLRIADTFAVSIIGGNIATSTKVVINVTVLGSLDNETALTRSTAREGDKIALTGYTGLSAAGLWIMKNKQSLDPEDETIFKKSHLQPLPRIAEGETLRALGVKTAIDISDGLLADLSHICSASKIKAIINKDLVPVHPSLKSCFLEEKYMQFILAGGEDYELMFTAPGNIIEDVKKRISSPVTIIGEIVAGTPGQVEMVNSIGKIYTFELKGWDHLKHE
jgi:thiamine-monophosphate kinase